MCTIARSMMAQTYLELLRVWTMNTQKRWLFERVHSVGIRVPTDLNKSFLGAEKLKEAKAKEAVKDAPITAIAGEDSYFKTKDPDEKGTILKHMRGHKTSGPTDYHFENFEHIICFDEETKKVLEKMKKLAEASLQDKSPPENVTSHIHWLDCGSLKNDEDENMENLRKTAGKIKVAIKGFLKRNFQWEKPAIAIADGEWRTLQVLVPEETQKKLKNDGKWTITKEVSKKKGVQIRIGRDAGAQYLVSISGPKGKLEDAQKMLSI
ncbi:hypothetical protein BGZ60DRAFT_420923 [Tricladium varicosporioides]|nr:hypothetical protein BGZ60DRAFT_420923 [Hymenoscyphus varicosporioides]